MTLPRRFKVKLMPGSYSEHQNEHLKQANGQTVEVVEELPRGLFRTTFRLDGTPGDSDYARDGFLLVMPDKDGTWTT